MSCPERRPLFHWGQEHPGGAARRVSLGWGAHPPTHLRPRPGSDPGRQPSQSLPSLLASSHPISLTTHTDPAQPDSLPPRTLPLAVNFKCGPHLPSSSPVAQPTAFGLPAGLEMGPHQAKSEEEQACAWRALGACCPPGQACLCGP